VFALGDGTNTGMTLTGAGLSLTPVDPVVFVDGEARLWDYTVLTQNTATVYGVPSINVHGYNGTLLPLRQHYAFTGETLQYFVVVMDGNGIADIASVDLFIEDALNVQTNIGSCAIVPDFGVDTGFKLVDYSGTPTPYDNATMVSYVCTLTVNVGWIGQYDIFVQAQDSLGAIAQGIEFDHFYFNPTIDIQTSGAITFGSVAQGTTAMSSTISLKNMATGVNVAGSAVLLDMYISSDQYFDDVNPLAACPTTDGLPYTALSYYATKGSVNSGTNNNDYPGVGENDTALCLADIDGFTQLVFENTGVVDNMCRIINWDFASSILAQGAEMSLTFKAEVPTPCTGTFTNGQFYFIGEVI